MAADRRYARYTMVSKLALGGAALAMTAALGGGSSFAVAALFIFARGAASLRRCC